MAALQVGAALVTITGYGTSVWVPRFAEGRLLALISLSSCALLLLIGGRRDHRARLLGVVFALGASSFSASFSWPLVSQVGVEVITGFSRGLPAGGHVDLCLGVSAGPSTNRDR